MLGVPADAARTVTAVGSEPVTPVIVFVPVMPPTEVLDDSTTTVLAALDVLVVVPAVVSPLTVGRTMVVLEAVTGLVTSMTVVVLGLVDPVTPA